MPKVYECKTFPMGTKIIGGISFEVKNSKIVCTDEMAPTVEESDAYKRGDIVDFKGSLDEDGNELFKQTQYNELKFLFDGNMVDALRKLPDDAKALIREYCKEVIDVNLGGKITDGSDQITIENESTTAPDPDNHMGDADTNNDGKPKVQVFTDAELQSKSVKVLLDLATNQYQISGLTAKTKKDEIVATIKAFYSTLPAKA